MPFVSLGIPDATMQRLVEQAERAHAVLVLRGIERDSIRETVLRVQRLIGNRQVSFQIDPQAFERYGISKVPTFALVRAGALAQKCAEHACMPGDSFASVAGDVSLDYALAHIQKSAPRFAKEAQVFLTRMGR
jgi:conjugal transfer pilus assembly protein TrbC